MKTLNPFTSALGAVALFAFGVLLGLGNLSGCGGKTADPNVNDDSESQSPENDATAKSPRPGAGLKKQPAGKRLASSGGRKRGVYTDKSGQKWWNKHPYDVWYDDAYEVARNQTPIGKGGAIGSGGKKVAEKKSTPKKTIKDPPPKAAGTDWKSLAEMAVLEAEVTSIRNFLARTMRTPASYRRDYKKVQYAGATLAALGQVIANHPGQLSWKEDALYVRDLGLAISEQATGLGVKEFRATKLPYEQLIDVLNRSKPAGLKTPDKNATFFDFASRGGLMNRMNESYNWLDKEINTDDKIKSEAERIRHEATVLAVLLKAIADSSFDRADDPGYQKLVRESIDHTQKIKSAVKAEDFETFRKSLSTIYNRCNECHNKYRG